MPTPQKTSPEVAALIDEHGQYVSFPQAAKIAATSVRTLKRYATAGALPVFQVGPGRVLRVRTADVAGLIRRVA